MQLTAANTAIVLDSTADLPDASERHPNWRMVPLYVRFGDESYRDYIELGPEAFYARLRTSPTMPATSQPTPGDFARTYEELAAYERIYSIHIPQSLSGTIQSARVAAEGSGDKVRTIDSGTASAAIALLAFAVQRRLDRGTTDEEIGELVERYKRTARILFTVDTLEFLQRGGRIGRAAAMAGQLLNVKPILTITDGEVVPLKRVRGNAKAMQAFVDDFTTATADVEGLRVGIAHADAPERAEQLVKMVGAERPKAKIELVTTLGAVVGTHAGPGTIGFFWFQDS
ncbi:MAG TPA: DegV family protein [Gaiellaceae bacterium]|nr:DegV family protein [Gaiellaceae bacterium]